MSSTNRESYIKECELIRQNCLYTAEAHHNIASRYKSFAFWFQIAPAVIAAASSSAAIANLANGALLNTIALIGAVATSVSSVINPNKVSETHLQAAKSFTILKHDARFLKDSRNHDLDDQAFSLAVENLHQRYNDYVGSVPPTDDKAFEEARQKIQKGIHDPD